MLMLQHKCTLNKLTASILLAVGVIGTPVYATDALTKNVENDKETQSQPEKVKTDDQNQQIEVIEVRGYRPNPISRNAEGAYRIDRKLIEDYRFGNGNLNDILGILPGVQYSEQSYSAEQISNIKPPEVSISGAEGYQSGYFIDGINNNSRLSTGNSQADRNLLQDVSGHSQASFINLDILESIEVLDSNIPAKYGKFSGGFVNAETRKAQDKPSWSLSYRQTSDAFVSYNSIYAADADGTVEIPEPEFEKRDFSASFTMPIGTDAGIVAQVQVLESRETQLQLDRLRPREQNNYNALLKYHQWLNPRNELIVSAVYAPFEGNYFDVYALRSDYTQDGGALNAKLEWQYTGELADIDTKLSWHNSVNNKDTGAYRFSWINAIGKKWGDFNGSTASVEGGYGSIEKVQSRLTLDQDFLLNEMKLGSARTQSSFGWQLNYLESEFNRLEDAIIYNSPVINSDVICGGYSLDCVEQQFYRPLSELEKEVGRALDPNDPNFDLADLPIYESNVSQTGQYFQRRQVLPQADVKVNLLTLAIYGEQLFDWDWLTATAGLRYDYNDFFKQHNIAPRFRSTYDIFDDGESVLVFGLNRYFDANLISHKLNEAIQPSYREIRRSYNHQPQQWERQIASSGYRNVYQDTKTPYSDELSLAFRQSLFGGTLEGKWLYRENKRQISRARDVNELGEDILLAENKGSSQYQRYSISWMANFDNQHVEVNVSYAENKVDKASFDGKVRDRVNTTDGVYYRLKTDYDDSDLVIVQYPDENDPTKPFNDEETLNILMTKNDLELSKRDFNRPVVGNISWGGRWGDWRLSAYARYHSKQDVYYATGKTGSIKDVSSICEGCIPTENQYPLYVKGVRPAFWLLSGSIKYNWKIHPEHQITFSFDGENLLNDRTYQIGKFSSGSELGRRFWLGISYRH